MKVIEDKIREFSNDMENQVELVALLKVGRDKNHDVLTIMQHVIANVLLRFHGIPVTGNDQN